MQAGSWEVPASLPSSVGPVQPPRRPLHRGWSSPAVPAAPITAASGTQAARSTHMHARYPAHRPAHACCPQRPRPEHTPLHTATLHVTAAHALLCYPVLLHL